MVFARFAPPDGAQGTFPLVSVRSDIVTLSEKERAAEKFGGVRRRHHQPHLKRLGDRCQVFV